VNGAEPTVQSFVLKIWLEETAEDTGEVTWRGYIMHVPSNERYYLQDLGRIPVIIARYLEQMGVKLGMLWRVRCWLNRSRLCESREH